MRSLKPIAAAGVLRLARQPLGARILSKLGVSMNTHSSRRINALARLTKAKSYLEIGVAQGDTFRDVVIEHKTAVDVFFDFDWKTLANERTSFFQKPSDAYFLEDVGDRRFDVVFIDGLHTFEQALRDFNNSLICANPGTVWLLDDTVPSDPYSAWPDVDCSIRLRKGAGLTDSSWHGDVYRLVFLLADFFPMLDYATIMDGKNPQTLVWRKPRRDFQPTSGGVEAVSRMHYMDMRLEIARMNPCTEAQALERIAASL